MEREALIFLESINMSTEERRAPRKAEMDMVHPERAPSTREMVTRSPAPELTPIIPGAARELESTLWRIAPERARAKPEKRAATVLGSLE